MTELPSMFGDYYREIYAKGMFASERPEQPIAWAELERAAEESLEERAVAYVWGGAGSEDTMRANLEAFRAWRIVPRVHARHLGPRTSRPRWPARRCRRRCCWRPSGSRRCSTTRASSPPPAPPRRSGLPLVVSTASSTSMEDMAEAGGAEAPRWYQLYWPSDRELAESLVRRAEASGHSAIVLTVDNSIVGWKPRDLQQAYLPFLEGIGIEQYLTDPVFRDALEKTARGGQDGRRSATSSACSRTPRSPGTTSSGCSEVTTLPIILKGVLHPDDAREARERGMAGVVVSNHGGRQIDGAIASLDALPAIADAVGGEIAVLLDSGVRSGADAFKALALGADAVLIGRPYLWGLALGRPGGRRDRAALHPRRARPDAGPERTHGTRDGRLARACNLRVGIIRRCPKR